MKAAAPSSPSSRWPVWLGCLVWGAVVSLGWLLCFRFPTFWLLAGIGEPGRPFLDLFGLLASCDAARQSLDPFLPNSLDPYHRPLVYSDWWLVLASLGLGRKDTLWLGAALAGALLVTALAWLRPRSWREGGLVLLFLFSPAFLLAVHRANNDLVILVIVSAGLICFRQDGWPWRAAGIVLFAVAAVLKYYPLVTLLLLLELRTWRRVLAGAALYAGVLLLAWPGLVPGLQSASRNAPAPEWLYAFGAPSLWRDFGSTDRAGWISLALVVLAWAAFRGWTGSRLAEPADAAARPAWREFICGAVMITGVFFLGASYVYKLVFALWLVPWLRRPPEAVTERRWHGATGLLLTATLWTEGVVALGLNILVSPNAPAALWCSRAR